MISGTVSSTGEQKAPEIEPGLTGFISIGWRKLDLPVMARLVLTWYVLAWTDQVRYGTA